MENFADIEGPVQLGILGLVIAVVAILAGIALAVLLIRWLARRPDSAAEAPTARRRSPFELAVERLESLRSSQSTLEAEPFTVEVSDIVRDYLEEALEVPAREQTSEEFLQTLQSREDMPGALQENMPPFLDACDRVKFARQSLGDAQRETLLNTAQIVVQSTDTHLRALREPQETAPAKP